MAEMLSAVRTRMVTGLRTPGVASPLQKQYLARSNKDSIVFRLKLTYININAVSRNTPTKGKILNKTKPPTYINK